MIRIKSRSHQGGPVPGLKGRYSSGFVTRTNKTTAFAMLEGKIVIRLSRSRYLFIFLNQIMIKFGMTYKK